MNRRDDGRFCPHCDIDLGLHGVDDPDDLAPEDCQYAARKADLLAGFFAPFIGRGE